MLLATPVLFPTTPRQNVPRGKKKAYCQCSDVTASIIELSRTFVKMSFARICNNNDNDVTLTHKKRRRIIQIKGLQPYAS